MKIKTENVYPPIPIRHFDWCAYDDDTYDGPGSTIGWGETEQETEQEAVADLMAQLEDQ
jgi:hypothetical protein